MASRKTRPAARTSASRRVGTLWRDARGTLRRAESLAGKRVAAFARRNGIDPKRLEKRAQEWRSRLDREGRRARKLALARFAELQQRARQQRRSLARVADDAVARALTAFNIPTRHEVLQLSRRVELLSNRVGSLRR